MKHSLSTHLEDSKQLKFDFAVENPKPFLIIKKTDGILNVEIPADVTLTEAARKFIVEVNKNFYMESMQNNTSSPIGYNTVLFCAFRYALGRSTHVVDTVVQAIHSHWNNLSDGDKLLYNKEILEHFEKFGETSHEIDKKAWMTIVDEYSNEKRFV